MRKITLDQTGKSLFKAAEKGVFWDKDYFCVRLYYDSPKTLVCAGPVDSRKPHILKTFVRKEALPIFSMLKMSQNQTGKLTLATISRLSRRLAL